MKVNTITQDLDRANPKPNTITLWRGNNVNGWQVNADEKRGPVGKLVPVLIEFPVDDQFSAIVKTDKGMISLQDYKGFRPEEEAHKAVPSPEIIEFHLDRLMTEIEITMKDKAKPGEIREEQELRRKQILTANKVKK